MIINTDEQCTETEITVRCSRMSDDIESTDKHSFLYTLTDVYESQFRLYELEAKLAGHDFMRASKNCLFNISHIFTMMVLAISIAGMLLARYNSKVQSTLFAPGGAGLSYSTLMQITGFTFIMAIFATLLFSEHFLIKILIKYRLEGKKYDRLLMNYKARHNDHQSLKEND